MSKDNKNGYGSSKLILVVIILLIVLSTCKNCKIETNDFFNNNKNTLTILSSYENSIVEDEVLRYTKKINKKVGFVYKGDLDIVEELNKNSIRLFSWFG